MNTDRPGSANGKLRGFDPRDPGSTPGPGASTAWPNGKAPTCKVGTSRFDSDRGVHTGVAQRRERFRAKEEAAGSSPAAGTTTPSSNGRMPGFQSGDAGSTPVGVTNSTSRLSGGTEYAPASEAGARKGMRVQLPPQSPCGSGSTVPSHPLNLHISKYIKPILGRPWAVPGLSRKQGCLVWQPRSI